MIEDIKYQEPFDNGNTWLTKNNANKKRNIYCEGKFINV